MRIRAGIAGCLVSVALSLAAGSAVAHESPPGCTSASLNPATTLETATMHRDGELIEFAPGYSNSGAGACDVTGFSVSITFPKPDGTAGGQTVVAGTNLTALGETGTVRLPVVPYTVNFDDGVYSGPVKVTISGGTFHGPGGDTPYGGGSSTSTLYISRPKVTMTVSAIPIEFLAGSPVTYTYKIKNESTSFPGDMGQVGMDDNEVTDDRCAPVTYVSGDGGFADILDVGETWTLTCTTTVNQVGVIVNHASYSGFSIRDAILDPVTATAEGTVISAGADLVVDVSHAGNFTRGETGSYSIVARNDGNIPASAAEDVTVTAAVPAGLKATGISGQGWNCDLASVTCGRAVALGAATALPPITLETEVADDAPNSVSTSATVAGGQDADTGNNSDTDLTIIDPKGPGPGPGPAPDVVVPRITKLKLSPSRFRVLKKRATKITWRLSEAATVRFRVDRRVNGRWKRVKGSFRATGKAGGNRLRFSGRVAGKKLKPGRHRLSAWATDPAGNASGAARRPFNVIRR